jgi:cytochrome c-type biogenesis protein CcmH/NrfG
MNEETERQILEELRKLNALAGKANRTNTVALTILGGVLLALAVVTIPLRHRLLSRPQSSSPITDSWRQARTLLFDQDEIQQAKEMVERLLQKHPDYYYGHSLLGSVYQELGNLEAAEKSYARAVELFPDEDNEKTLAAVRKAIQTRRDAANQPAQATGKPAPGR